MAMTLRAVRVNKNLTQEKAAELLGVSVDALRSWERGKTFPNVMQLKRIESTYDVSYNDITFCPESTV